MTEPTIAQAVLENDIETVKQLVIEARSDVLWQHNKARSNELKLQALEFHLQKLEAENV